MIWMMDRRTVVATMVGGNCNMDETLVVIWTEMTIQSNALLPVLRLIALRAMKGTTVHRDWKAKYSIFYVIQSSTASNQIKVSGPSKGVCLTTSSVTLTTEMVVLCRIHLVCQLTV